MSWGIRPVAHSRPRSHAEAKRRFVVSSSETLLRRPLASRAPRPAASHPVPRARWNASACVAADRAVLAVDRSARRVAGSRRAGSRSAARRSARVPLRVANRAVAEPDQMSIRTYVR